MADSDKPKPWQALLEPTEDTVACCRRLIGKGLPLASVARYMATTETRLKRWLDRGMILVEEGGDIAEEEQIYAVLFLEAGKAHAYYEEQQLTSLNDPDNALWRRALSVLERRDPRHWNRAPMDGFDTGGEEFAADDKFV